MAKEKEDIFVPFLPSCLTVDNFDEYRKSFIDELKSKQKEKVELSLSDSNRSFGITLNTIVIKNNFILLNNFASVLENSADILDNKFFEKSESPLFKRWIYYLDNPLEILNEEFFLYINVSKFSKYEFYIYTFTLTTFNPIQNQPKYVLLSNVEVICLSKKCDEVFNSKEFLEYLKNNKDNLKKKLEENFKDCVAATNSIQTSMDDTFKSIQLWGKPEQYDKLKDDAREIINANIRLGKLDKMYYFYSILTHNHECGILRKHFENIAYVMGYCQSVSKAYFDFFYGNVCLEVTINPNYKIFQQTGHDSEEFRIWEILALQSHIVKDKKLKLEDFKVFEALFDFRDFTKKLGKGGFWIDYANYLKEVTGIQHNYNIKKREIELEEKEREKALQKLNLLIIVSIFISILTFFLSPIYNESANSTNLSNVINNSFYKNHILNKSNPELTLFFMAGAFVFVLSLCLFVLVKYIKNIINWIFYPIRYFQKKEHIFDLILVLLLAIGVIFLLWMKLKSIT